MFESADPPAGGVTEGGEKVWDTPGGSPDTLNVTGALNPAAEVIVSVRFLDEPAAISMSEVAAAIPKSGPDVITNVTAIDRVRPPPDPEMVKVWDPVGVVGEVVIVRSERKEGFPAP